MIMFSKEIPLFWVVHRIKNSIEPSSRVGIGKMMEEAD